MAANPRRIHPALQLFLQQCSEDQTPLQEVEDAACNIAKKAHEDLMEAIKPGRYVVGKKPVQALPDNQDADNKMDIDNESLVDPQQPPLAQHDENLSDDEMSTDEEKPQFEAEDCYETTDGSQNGDELSNLQHDCNINEDSTLPETHIMVNGLPIPIWHYLGKDWTTLICDLDEIQPIQQPRYCATPLKPWQLSGVAKLRFLGNSHFRGAVFGDEQGLGKTLTMLTTIMEDIMTIGADEYEGFNLIITTKSCIYQWVQEIRLNFPPEIAERVFILDDVRITACELLDRKYLFVLCTYQFVQSRWTSLQRFKDFYEVVDVFGWEETMATLHPGDVPPNVNQKPVSALFSSVYRELQLPIKHLVLDEAQAIKNIHSKTYDAIKNGLYYDRVFLLSGTFLANKWYDAFGLISMLRGHSFKTYDQFMKTFAHKGANNIYAEPSASKRNRLIKFMQAFVVSRPASLMELKNMVKSDHLFELNETDEAIVAEHVRQFIKALRPTRKDGRLIYNDFAKDSSKAKALLFAIRAQQYCASPILLGNRAQANEEKLYGRGRALLDQLVGEGPTAAGQPLVKRLRKLMSQGRTKTSESKDELLVHDESSAETSKVSEAQDGVNSGDNEGREDVLDDILEDPNQMIEVDEDLDDNHNTAIEDKDDSDDNDDGKENRRKAKSINNRREWLRQVEQLSDKQLLTPKLHANLELVQHIQQKWPGEKIVVFSRLLKYLDLLDEALKRKLNLRALRFHGSLSQEERKIVKDAFDKPENSNVLLITAGSGGAGLNLTTGSKIIQCEPWWNANDEAQSYSRCWRLGQSTIVHVWVLRGVNSLIDNLMSEAKDKKSSANQEIIRFLRHEDDAEFVIPKQHKYGVGEY